MNVTARIGPATAEIVLFNKGGRDFRMARLERGEETPREFFYGYFDVLAAGLSANMLSSAGAVPGVAGAIADRIERAFAALTGFGVRPLSARLSAGSFAKAKVVMSYTDGFSLSLGLGLERSPDRPVLMGGFHCLSDIEGRAPAALRGLVRSIIRRSLAGLDYLFFFGPADRQISIERYGLPEERSSVIRFGVDTEFWRPLPGEPAADFVVAVGQDHNRDYDLLASIPGGHPIRIVTRQPVRVPPDATNVSTTVGDYFGSDAMTDEELRRLYNMASAVVVPLKDVYQPSGYSVTLQAMSCGRPIILTRTRGLWAPELFVDGANCLLVPPGDRAALAVAVGRLRSDHDLAARIGLAGRELALAHFNLAQIGKGSVELARLGLKLHAARAAASSRPGTD